MKPPFASLFKVFITLILLIIIGSSLLFVTGHTDIIAYLFQPHAGSCLILEQKYCSNYTIITITGQNGISAKYAAFSIPAGTLVFSPADGTEFAYETQVDKSLPTPSLQINVAQTVDKNSPNPQQQVMYSLLVTKNNSVISKDRVKKNQILATLSKTPVYKNYLLLFSIATASFNLEKRQTTTFFKFDAQKLEQLLQK